MHSCLVANSGVATVTGRVQPRICDCALQQSRKRQEALDRREGGALSLHGNGHLYVRKWPQNPKCNGPFGALHLGWGQAGSLVGEGAWLGRCRVTPSFRRVVCLNRCGLSAGPAPLRSALSKSRRRHTVGHRPACRHLRSWGRREARNSRDEVFAAHHAGARSLRINPY